MKEDLEQLIRHADLLYLSLLNELGMIKEAQKKIIEKKKIPSFKQEYESWYSEALILIKQVLPERLVDFSILYKNDKRKEIDFLTYTISDYLIGLTTTRAGQVLVDGKAALPKFNQQTNILKSVQRRFESSLFDIKQIVQADIFDDELDSASELLKNGFLRGAGAIAGVILEKHLSQVYIDHEIKGIKKNPSINDFNDILKTNNVIDVPTWRFIQLLGDIRNICDHNKEIEPTKDNVIDLINGVKKIIKSVF
jgi:hypothetical protein